MEYHCILETLAGADTLSRNPMSVVAVADCTAPSSCGVHPHQAISKMQVLLYATEDEGRLLPIAFGTKKCQLLISGRPAKIRQTYKILEEDSGSLTFYDHPVTIIKPGELYKHLGFTEALKPH